MKITVPKEIIQNAIRRDSHHCMIADAIKLKNKWAQYIVVDLQTIRFSNPNRKERYTYLTPPIAQKNLLKFDQGDKSILPFEFTLKGLRIRKMNTKTGSKKYGKKARKGNKAGPVIRMKKERKFGIRMFDE